MKTPKKQRHLGIVGNSTPNIVRLRPVVPAHLRTDFKPEDADIRTLVQNVLKSRNRLQAVKTLVEKRLLEGVLPVEVAGEIIDLINKPEEP